MINGTLIIVGFYVLFLFQADSEIGKWKRISPLQSSRAEVENLLGGGDSVCKCVYDLEEVTVQVTYSEGSCKSGTSGGCNVPEGTVLRFNVKPKKPTRLTSLLRDLGLERRKLTKTEDPELPGIFHYVDRENGVVISATEDKVIDYGFEPTERDRRLRCPMSCPQ